MLTEKNLLDFSLQSMIDRRDSLFVFYELKYHIFYIASFSINREEYRNKRLSVIESTLSQQSTRVEKERKNILKKNKKKKKKNKKQKKGDSYTDHEPHPHSEIATRYTRAMQYRRILLLVLHTSETSKPKRVRTL